ncbi:hypothetical protein HK100_005165, partial [Physocladia obscura]
MSCSRTTDNEYQVMLNWVEVPKNFQLVVGAAVTKAKVISGLMLAKQSVFVAMAAHKNTATTGFGLTEDDQKKEIMTINAKL